MRSSDTIQKDIAARFEMKSGKRIQRGSVIDLYTSAVGDTLHGVYQAIEDAKNPHLFTKLKGQELDDMGFGVNCPRKDGEDDASYLYRMMQWKNRMEASNTNAISVALLQPKYASNIEYIPFVYGSGTGVCYVIPRYYDAETIANALAEAARIIKEVASPSLYVEYIVPAIRAVKPIIFLSAPGSDLAAIQANIERKTRAYINAIAPKEYLKVGELNRIGINEPGVEYFSVLSLVIDNEETMEIEVLQTLDSKFLYDEIVWRLEGGAV